LLRADQFIDLPAFLKEQDILCYNKPMVKNILKLILGSALMAVILVMVFTLYIYTRK